MRGGILGENGSWQSENFNGKKTAPREFSFVKRNSADKIARHQYPIPAERIRRGGGKSALNAKRESKGQKTKSGNWGGATIKRTKEYKGLILKKKCWGGYFLFSAGGKEASAAEMFPKSEKITLTSADRVQRLDGAALGADRDEQKRIKEIRS